MMIIEKQREFHYRFWSRGTCGAYFLGCLIIFIGFLPLIAEAIPVTEENILHKIFEAKTAADHQALAVYFRVQASESAKKIERHEKMIKVYTKPRNGPAYSIAVLKHCKTLIRIYLRAQEQNIFLAEKHEQLAKDLSSQN